MKLLLILLICLFPIIFCAPSNTEDLDGQDDDNLEEFEEYFHLDEITDPEEKEKREEALKVNEKIVKEQNQEYLDGKSGYALKINEFSDLPADEFLKTKTGDIPPPEGENRKYFYGDIQPSESDRVVDEASENFFNALRKDMKEKTPSAYNSVTLGHVSPVKNQRNCGACVAFANMALIDTCFKRITGVFSDFSEQQMVDCGYGKDGAEGCKGAYSYAYAKWAVGKELLAEGTYPYKNKQPSLTCPSGLKTYNRGAKVSAAHYTYSGTEDLLKAAVAKHGAVTTSVNGKPFAEYNKGVFSGCTAADSPPTTKQNHAVTVVGYGNENGEDYWLIKNSYGPSWGGEGGYLKLKRGEGQCGVGKTIVVVTCERVTGPTSATLTTEAPCYDKAPNCAAIQAEKYCWQSHVRDGCKKSCGLCKGMTPAASNTCWDEYPFCAQFCVLTDLATTKCRKACNKC